MPFGAFLVFATSPRDRVTHTYSYFDLSLIGYANFAPMLTGILTVIALILGIIALCKYEKAAKIRNARFVRSRISGIMSLVPLFMAGQ